MQTVPTPTPAPAEPLTSTEIPVDPFVRMATDFIAGVVQYVASSTTGALILGLIVLLLFFRVRRHRY